LGAERERGERVERPRRAATAGAGEGGFGYRGGSGGCLRVPRGRGALGRPHPLVN